MGHFFQPSPDVATNFRKIPAKLAPRCAKSRPRWAKMATRWPKMGQDGNKMAILAPTWEVLVRSWPQLVRFWGVPGRILGAFLTILADRWYIQKLYQNCSFYIVFGHLGLLIWGILGILAPSPYDVARSWRHDGSKIDKNRPRWVQDPKKTLLTAILGPSWRQVGPNNFFQVAPGGARGEKDRNN